MDYKKLVTLYDHTYFGKEGVALVNPCLDLQPFEEKIGERGIDVNHQVIKDVFEQIEPEFCGNKIQLSELKKRMHDMGIDFNMEDQNLITFKEHITSGELYNLIRNNDLGNFDPLEESFHLLDPENTGGLDLKIVNKLFQRFGYEPLDFNE